MFTSKGLLAEMSDTLRRFDQDEPAIESARPSRLAAEAR